MKLTEGSRLKVIHQGSADEGISSEGTLEGFVAVGMNEYMHIHAPEEKDEDGGVIDKASDTPIPSLRILFIDVLELAEDKEKVERDRMIE